MEKSIAKITHDAAEDCVVAHARGGQAFGARRKKRKGQAVTRSKKNVTKKLPQPAVNDLFVRAVSLISQHFGGSDLYVYRQTDESGPAGKERPVSVCWDCVRVNLHMNGHVFVHVDFKGAEDNYEKLTDFDLSAWTVKALQIVGYCAVYDIPFGVNRA